MRTTYAVNWQERAEPPRTGKLELRPRSLVVEGMNGMVPSSAEILYREISAIRVARLSSEKIAGRATLVLDLRRGASIRIAGVAQPGIVSELAEHLARLQLGEEQAVSRVLVVIPLKAGTTERVRSIVRTGPPFDPEAVNLERHHVFLTETEAIFVFEGRTPEAIEPLVGEARVWSAASEWAEVAAGPPRIADDVYDWIRADPPENVTYSSTPGPGDSDGGDLYAPS